MDRQLAPVQSVPQPAISTGISVRGEPLPAWIASQMLSPVHRSHAGAVSVVEFVASRLVRYTSALHYMIVRFGRVGKESGG